PLPVEPSTVSPLVQRQHDIAPFRRGLPSATPFDSIPIRCPSVALSGQPDSCGHPKRLLYGGAQRPATGLSAAACLLFDRRVGSRPLSNGSAVTPPPRPGLILRPAGG